jgi:predicted protein tyrosine phosphatase
MAITTVRAVPYSDMAEYLRGESPARPCAALAASHDRVWIISVTSSPRCPTNAFEGWDEGGPVALCEDGDDRIALAFDDVEPRADPTTHTELGRNARYVYFDHAMAQKVCRFIRRAHGDDPARRDLLLINCHAGVSRSGAIGDFARSVTGGDYSDFKRLNPQVVPNAHVRRTLFEAWAALGGGPHRAAVSALPRDSPENVPES